MADNKHVSGIRYSALNAMHSCELNAFLIYGKDKLQGRQNEFATLGIVLHDILDDYAKHCYKNKIDTDYTELDKIKYKHFCKLAETQVTDANNIFQEIKGNFNFNTINSFENVLIEKRFKLDFDFNPTESEDEWYLSGAIDIVYADDDTIYAEDYKSVRSIYTKSFMEQSLQKKIYCLLLLKHFPNIDTIQFAFNFIRYGYRSDWMTTTRDSLEALEDEIRAECVAFEELVSKSSPPDPTPSGFCMLCPIRGKCTAYDNAFSDFEQIETEDDAKELYQQLVLAKHKTKSMEEMLKWWIEHNHPLEFKYEIYGPQVYPEVKFNDPERLMKILQEEQVPQGAIFELVGITKTKVERLIKKFKLGKDLQNRIYSVATESKTTKFVSKKKEEEKSDEDGSIDPYI